MKSQGFSLVELLIVLAISATIIGFAVHSYKDTKLKTEIKLDQQYLLTLPSAIEGYFARNLQYPNQLNELGASHSTHTPKRFYSINYTNSDDSYRLMATAVDVNRHSRLRSCYRLTISSTGKLESFNQQGNQAANCWN